ncbi:MAG: glycosyltransferase family 39 protein [Hydrogenophilus sp.]|nr:glycosyltransferase family 39 protein [Hydrogenophilus sp.]
MTPNLVSLLSLIRTLPSRALPARAASLNTLCAGACGDSLILILIALLTLFPNLGGYPLFDVDEGAFAEATREMWVSGDYGMTTLDGVPRYDKPILTYWLQLLAIALLGETPLAVRLPSAIAGLLWVLATWHFVRARFGRTPALLAGFILATALGPWAIARAATADALLNLFLALSLFDLWRYLESHRLPHLRRAHLWIALGLLTKGPIALLIPYATLTLYLVSRRQWARLSRVLLEPRSWLILITVALPWYLYALGREGWAFIEGFFLKHNLQRFATPLERHSGPLGYYLLVIPLLLLPWTPLLLRPLRALRTDTRSMLRRFLWIWFLFVLLFFTLAQTKLPHYALYGLTPLTILIAVHATSSPRPASPTPILLTALLSLTLLMFLPNLLAYLVPRHPTLNDYYRALLADSTAAWGFEQLLAAIAALLLILTLPRVAARHLPRFLPSLFPLFSTLPPLLAVLPLTLWLSHHLLPWAGETLQGPIVRAAQTARGHPVVNIGLRAPSFSFIRGAPTPKRPPDVGEWFLTRIDRLPDFPYRIRFIERGLLLGERLPSPPLPSLPQPPLPSAP